MGNTLTVHNFAVQTRHATSVQSPCGCASLSDMKSLETRVVVGIYPPPILSDFKAVLAFLGFRTHTGGFCALKRKVCGFFKTLESCLRLLFSYVVFSNIVKLIK